MILVTHFMEEAEELCDRLAIVDQQRVIATGTPQELIARSAQGIRVRFSTDHEDIAWLADVDYVEQVERQGDQVEVRGAGPVLALVAAALVGHGIVPADLRVEQATLEDVFLELTGRTKGGDW